MINNPYVTVLSWADIKAQVQSFNPSLVNAIATIKEGDSFPVVRVRYPFGADIAKDGKFYIPHLDGSIAYDDPSIDPGLKSLLAYPWKVTPVGLITHNACEIFVDLPSHHSPLSLFTKGKMLSVLSLIEPEWFASVMASAYSAKAGCRSLLLLPKIADTQSHQRLTERLNLGQIACPEDFSMQWPLFEAIGSATQTEDSWYTEVIYFGKPFFHALATTPEYKHQLTHLVWPSSVLFRHQVVYDVIWQTFIDEHCLLKLRNNVAVVQTVKHLLKVCLGQAPGYMPVSNEESAPIKLLTHSYLSLYNIRYHWPVFMQIVRWNFKEPLYYSLSHPLFMHPLSTAAKGTSSLRDIIAVKHVLGDFIDKALTHQLCFSLAETRLLEKLQDLEFDYFHLKGDIATGIRSDIDALQVEDSRFMHMHAKAQTKKSYGFPKHSDFFRGCIRIRPKAKSLV